jgi:hypothetical protein
MIYPLDPPGLPWDGWMFNEQIADALREYDVDTKARPRNGPAPSIGPDVRISRRVRPTGYRYIQARWTGNRAGKCFPDTAEGLEAARQWRDSEFVG